MAERMLVEVLRRVLERDRCSVTTGHLPHPLGS